MVDKIVKLGIAWEEINAESIKSIGKHISKLTQDIDKLSIKKGALPIKDFESLKKSVAGLAAAGLNKVNAQLTNIAQLGATRQIAAAFPAKVVQDFARAAVGAGESVNSIVKIFPQLEKMTPAWVGQQRAMESYKNTLHSVNQRFYEMQGQSAISINALMKLGQAAMRSGQSINTIVQQFPRLAAGAAVWVGQQRAMEAFTNATQRVNAAFYEMQGKSQLSAGALKRLAESAIRCGQSVDTITREFPKLEASFPNWVAQQRAIESASKSLTDLARSSAVAGQAQKMPLTTAKRLGDAAIQQGLSFQQVTTILPRYATAIRYLGTAQQRTNLALSESCKVVTLPLKGIMALERATGRTTGRLNKMQMSLVNLSKSAAPLRTSLNNVKKGFGEMGATVNKAIGVYTKFALVIFTTREIFGRMITTLIDFMGKFRDLDEAIAASAAAASTSGRSFMEMHKAVGDLALEVGALPTVKYAPMEVAESIDILAKAGIDVANMTAQELTPIMHLAEATFTDLGTTVNYVSAIMAGFDLSMVDTKRIADVMTKAAYSTRLTFEELGKGFMKVGGMANLLGISMEEVAAAMAIGTQQGFSAEESATALRAAFIEMTREGSKANKLLLSAGISTEELSKDNFSLVNITTKLNEAGINQVEIMQAFGRRALKIMPALVEGTAQFASLTDAMLDSGGIAEEMATKALSTFAGAVDTFKGQVQTVKDLIAMAVAPALADLLVYARTEVMPGVIEAFHNMRDALGKMEFPAAKRALAALGETAIDLANSLAKNPELIEDIVTVFASLADVAIKLIKPFSWIIKIFGPFIKELTALLVGLAAKWLLNKLAIGGVIGSLVRLTASYTMAGEAAAAAGVAAETAWIRALPIIGALIVLITELALHWDYLSVSSDDFLDRLYVMNDEVKRDTASWSESFMSFIDNIKRNPIVFAIEAPFLPFQKLRVMFGDFISDGERTKEALLNIQKRAEEESLTSFTKHLDDIEEAQRKKIEPFKKALEEAFIVPPEIKKAILEVIEGLEEIDFTNLETTTRQIKLMGDQAKLSYETDLDIFNLFKKFPELTAESEKSLNRILSIDREIMDISEKQKIAEISRNMELEKYADNEVKQEEIIKKYEEDTVDRGERINKLQKEKNNIQEEYNINVDKGNKKLDELQEGLEDTINYMKEVPKTFEAITGSVQELIDWIGKMSLPVGQLEDFGDKASKALPNIQRMAEIMTEMAEMITTSEWTDAITEIVESIFKMGKALTDIIDDLDAFDAAQKVMKNFMDSIKSIFEMFELFKKIIDATYPSLDEVSAGFHRLTTEFAAVADWMATSEEFKKDIETLKDSFISIINSIGLFVGAVEYAIPVLKTFGDEINAIIGFLEVLTKIGEAPIVTMHNLEIAFSKLTNSLKESATFFSSAFWSSISSSMISAVKTITSSVEGMITSLKDEVKTLKEFGDIINPILSFMEMIVKVSETSYIGVTKLASGFASLTLNIKAFAAMAPTFLMSIVESIESLESTEFGKWIKESGEESTNFITSTVGLLSSLMDLSKGFEEFTRVSIFDAIAGVFDLWRSIENITTAFKLYGGVLVSAMSNLEEALQPIILAWMRVAEPLSEVLDMMNQLQASFTAAAHGAFTLVFAVLGIIKSAKLIKDHEKELEEAVNILDRTVHLIIKLMGADGVKKGLLTVEEVMDSIIDKSSISVSVSLSGASSVKNQIGEIERKLSELGGKKVTIPISIYDELVEKLSEAVSEGIKKGLKNIKFIIKNGEITAKSMQKGGEIAETGLYKLHKGEEVIASYENAGNAGIGSAISGITDKIASPLDNIGKFVEDYDKSHPPDKPQPVDIEPYKGPPIPTDIKSNEPTNKHIDKIPKDIDNINKNIEKTGKKLDPNKTIAEDARKIKDEGLHWSSVKPLLKKAAMEIPIAPPLPQPTVGTAVDVGNAIWEWAKKSEVIAKSAEEEEGKVQDLTKDLKDMDKEVKNKTKDFGNLDDALQTLTGTTDENAKSKEKEKINSEELGKSINDIQSKLPAISKVLTGQKDLERRKAFTDFNDYLNDIKADGKITADELSGLQKKSKEIRPMLETLDKHAREESTKKLIGSALDDLDQIEKDAPSVEKAIKDKQIVPIDTNKIEENQKKQAAKIGDITKGVEDNTKAVKKVIPKEMVARDIDPSTIAKGINESIPYLEGILKDEKLNINDETRKQLENSLNELKAIKKDEKLSLTEAKKLPFIYDDIKKGLWKIPDLDKKALKKQLDMMKASRTDTVKLTWMANDIKEAVKTGKMARFPIWMTTGIPLGVAVKPGAPKPVVKPEPAPEVPISEILKLFGLGEFAKAFKFVSDMFIAGEEVIETSVKNFGAALASIPALIVTVPTEAIKAFTRMVMSPIDAFSSSIMTITGKINALAALPFDMITKIVTDVASSFTKLLALPFDMITKVVTSVTDSLTKLLLVIVPIDLIVSAATKTVDSLTKVVTWLPDTIVDVANKFTDSMLKFLPSELLLDATNKVVDSMVNLATYIPDKIIDMINTITSKIIDVAFMPAEALTTTIDKVIDKFLGLLLFPVDLLTKSVGTVIDKFIELGSLPFTLLTDAIENSVNKIINLPFDTASKVLNSFIDRLLTAAELPIDVFINSINKISTALVDTATLPLTLLTKSATSLSDEFIKLLSLPFSEFISGIENITTSLTSLVSVPILSVSDMFTSLAASLSDLITIPFSTLTSYFTDIMSSMTTFMKLPIDVMISGITSFAESITKLVTLPVDTFVDYVNSLAETFTEFISLPLTLIIDSVSKFGENLASIVSLPITSYISIITKLADNFGDLVSLPFSSLISFVNKFTDIIGDLIALPLTTLIKAIGDFADVITTFLTSPITTLAKSIVEVVDKSVAFLTLGITTATKLITDLFSQAVKLISLPWDTIIGITEKLTDMFTTMVTLPVKMIVDNFEKLNNMIVELLILPYDTLTKFINEIVEKMQKFLFLPFDTFESLIGDLVENLTKIAFLPLDEFFSVFETLFKFIKDTALMPLNETVAVIKELREEMVKFITLPLKTFSDLFSDVIKKITDFLLLPIDKFEEIIDNLVKNLIALPYTEIVKITNVLVDSITKVITLPFDTISKTVIDLFNSVTKVATLPFDNVVKLFGDFQNVLVDILSFPFSKIISSSNNILEKISKLSTYPFDVLFKFFDDIESKIMAFLSISSSTMIKVIDDLSGTILDTITSPLKTLTDLISNLNTKFSDFLTLPMKSVTDVFGGLAKTASDLVALPWSTVIDAAKGFGSNLLAFASIPFDNVTTSVKTVSDTLTKFISLPLTAFVDIISSIVDSVTKLSVAPLTLILDTLGKTSTAISDIILLPLTSISTVINDIITSISNLASAPLVEVSKTIAEVFSSLSAVFTTPFKEMIDTIHKFSEIINGLIIPPLEEMSSLMYDLFRPLSMLNSITGSIRSFDRGGYVSDDMIGLLHKGEYVMPRTQTHTVNLYVNNTVGNNADVNSIADAILRRIEGTARF